MILTITLDPHVIQVSQLPLNSVFHALFAPHPNPPKLSGVVSVMILHATEPPSCYHQQRGE